jgi:hypothetical protein
VHSARWSWPAEKRLRARLRQPHIQMKKINIEETRSLTRMKGFLELWFNVGRTRRRARLRRTLVGHHTMEVVRLPGGVHLRRGKDFTDGGTVETPAVKINVTRAVASRGRVREIDRGCIRENEAARSRDGNGYPKPETRWVKTLLGHGYGGF